MNNASPDKHADHRAKRSFLPGVTPLSVATILSGLVIIGFMIQIGDVHAGASFMIGGLFALPLHPVMVVAPLILISGLVYALKRKSIYTRAEMICILAALLLAPPIFTEGFWSYIVGGTVTIPQTSDMAKLDGMSDKMWPHGENLTGEALNQDAAADTLVTKGTTEWRVFQVGPDEHQTVPVLRNDRPDGHSAVRVRLPLFVDQQLHLFLNEPYLLTVLARANELESESYYYCRIFYDDATAFASEVFSSREPAKPGYLRPDGFIRKGLYGVTFGPTVEREAVIELGLIGRGEVAFADLSLVNVSVITELYDGRKVMSAAQYEALPAKLRGRVLVQPDSWWSLAGVKWILSGGIPFREWTQPAIFWMSYLALLLTGTFVIAVIMRRQWVENERYPLPVAQIPIRLLGLNEHPDDLSTGRLPTIWKTPVMWAGFAVTLVWCVMKIWSAYNASVPNLGINVPLGPYFSDSALAPVFNQVNLKVASIFLAIGLFMELNILMTLVIGYFLYRAQYWVGETYGLSSMSEYPFAAEQMNGSYLMYALLVIFFTRKYLRGVLVQAVRGQKLDAECDPEVLSYRACMITLVLCFGGVALWADWAGIGMAGMLVFYTITLLVSFVAAKLRAECGVPFSTYFPYGIFLLVPLFGGAPLIAPGGFIFIAIISEIFFLRSFLLIPGIQLEAIELGRRARVAPRHLIYVCVLGLIGAWIIGGWFTLSNSYTTGMGTPSQVNRTYWFNTYGGYIKSADQSAATPETSAESERTASAASFKADPALWATFFGASTVAAITVLRQFFAGLWFHPIGLLVGSSWMIQEAWGSLLLAWLIRFSVLKLGGAATVRTKLMPFAVGIFLGGTTAYFFYFVTVSYLKFFVPGVKNIWWSLWAL
jgi:hypothetical protein